MILIRPVLLLFLFFSVTAWSQTYVSVEGAGVWQTRNDQRIPGNTGTQFSISDQEDGPFLGYRAYVGHVWNKTHELRALYAPLEVEVDGQFATPVLYKSSTFAANTPTTFYYKFNSYRLTYAYHFANSGAWSLAIGFTGKIRDAEVKLTQGTLSESKSNVGFVPLLHFQAKYDLGDKTSVRLDFDGLAAPQGRAFDVGLFAQQEVSDGLEFFAGYRTVEGGADNDEVYNFAWFHYATLGLNWQWD